MSIPLSVLILDFSIDSSLQTKSLKFFNSNFLGIDRIIVPEELRNSLVKHSTDTWLKITQTQNSFKVSKDDNSYV